MPRDAAGHARRETAYDGLVHETRTDEPFGSSRGTASRSLDEHAVDDWLGDISDDDWDEGSAPRPRPGDRPARRATSYRDEPDDPWSEGAPDRASRVPADGAADARRATIERRRYTAGLALLVLVGVAVVVPVMLLRGGGSDQVAAVDSPAVTAPVPTESTPTTPTPTTSTPTTPTTSTPSETTPAAPTTTTEPSTTTGQASFTLPEGTKLRLGEENDPALVTELQQALTAAGYDPGSADGTFGPDTKAAVVAFQQDNDLVPDGVVGAETAAALNAALARD